MFSSKSKSKAWIWKGIFLSFVLWILAKLLQSYLALCDLMDCSPPGSFVQRILQASILQWVAMPSSRGSSWPRDGTQVSCLLHWQVGSLPLHAAWETPFVFFCACELSHFSCVQLFVTSWTVAHQAPLSMEFSRQAYWNGLPCPSPGDLPDPGIEPSQAPPELAGGFFTTSTTWNDSK